MRYLRPAADNRLAHVAADIRVAIGEHFAMIDAISRGAADELANIIRTHIQGPKDFYLKATYIQGAL